MSMIGGGSGKTKTYLFNIKENKFQPLLLISTGVFIVTTASVFGDW